jgi:uncharacterized glyoxalase superfamily protein PhnB
MGAALQRAAPIFCVRNVANALAHYQRLGFSTRIYDGDSNYGFATRDGVELHLGVASPEKAHPVNAYVFVDDADALAHEWRAAGAEVHGPEDTPWGKREGALVDPDGNIIRFGSALR